MEEIGEMSQLIGVSVNGIKVFAELSGNLGLFTFQSFAKLCKLLDSGWKSHKMNATGSVSLKQLRFKEGDSLAIFEISEKDKDEVFRKMKKAGLTWTDLPDFDETDGKIYIMMGSSSIGLFNSIIESINSRKVKANEASPEETVGKQVDFEEYMGANGFVDEKGKIDFKKFDEALKEKSKEVKKEQKSEKEEQKQEKKTVNINGQVYDINQAVRDCVDRATRNDNTVDKYFIPSKYVLAEDANNIVFRVNGTQLAVDKSLIFKNEGNDEIIVCVSEDLYETNKFRIYDTEKDDVRFCSKEEMNGLKETINQREKQLIKEKAAGKLAGQQQTQSQGVKSQIKAKTQNR